MIGKRARAENDDRVLPLTRALAVVIIPFLIVAFLILYLVPERSGELFAWPIGPPMTAMMLAAAYLGGAFFFTRVALTKRWHTVALGFLPVSAFAGFLGIATLLHWDAFSSGHPSFIVWAALYLGLPPVIVLTWFLNRGTDPRTPDTSYLPIPYSVRAGLGLVGVVLITLSLFFMVFPEVVVDYWPWRLSLLTGRVMAALFVLPGVVAVGMALDGRWTSARIILQAQIGSIILIVLAVFLSRDHIDWTRFTAYVFAGGMALLGLGLLILYRWMERRTAA